MMTRSSVAAATAIAAGSLASLRSELAQGGAEPEFLFVRCGDARLAV